MLSPKNPDTDLLRPPLGCWLPDLSRFRLIRLHALRCASQWGYINHRQTHTYTHDAFVLRYCPGPGMKRIVHKFSPFAAGYHQ